MIRFLFYCALLAGFIFVGNWLFQHPGEIQVTWLGYEITLHIAILALALLLLIFVAGFFAITFWRLFTWPSRRRMRIQQRTFKRGLAQLTRGVTALAMGDEETAEEALAKALLALPGEPLPQLLSAQLLQRQGKHADAQLQFHTLMKHPITTGLATRRLIEQHVARHEWREAAKLAEEARKDSPRDRWLALTLIDLHARDKNTAQMLALTEGWQWQSPLTKLERYHYAALAYTLAAQASNTPRIKAQQLRHAVGYAPDFLPAVIDYAYTQLAQDAPRSARKLLLAAWVSKPASILIEPILAALKNEPPRTQLRLLKPFLQGELLVPHHLLIARQALSVEELSRARSALTDALGLEENKEALTLMADIERRQNGADAARSWLARAVDAPQGMGWVCMSCGTLHAQWQAHCNQCQSFDTLRYERPEARITSLELTPTASLIGELI